MPVITDVIQGLADPEALLRHFLISISGDAPGNAPANGQASERRFRVRDLQSNALGFTRGLSGLRGKEKNRPRVQIDIIHGPPVGNAGNDEIDAYYIPMVQTSDVSITNSHSHYTLPTNGNLRLMLTSQMSGCTFGIGSDAQGTTIVTHIQPTHIAGNTQAYSQTNLRGIVDSSTPNIRAAFRKRTDYATTATVIGKFIGNRWRFYMQASGVNANTIRTIDKVIVV